MAKPINFQDYFHNHTVNTATDLKKIEHELAQGSNYKLDNKVYNIKIIETPLEDGLNTQLILRMYSKTELCAFSYFKGNVESNKLFNSKRNRVLSPFLAFTSNQKVDGDKTPVFEGQLSEEEETFYEQHPDLKPTMKEVKKEEEKADTNPPKEVKIEEEKADTNPPKEVKIEEEKADTNPPKEVKIEEEKADTNPPPRRRNHKSTAVITCVAVMVLLGYGVKKRYNLSMPAMKLPSMPNMSAYNPWRKGTAV